MPPQYLILRQIPGQSCEVVFYDSDKQTREVKFSGGRWAARRFMRDLCMGIGWENIPCFCEKKSKGGHPPSIIEIHNKEKV